MIPSIVTSSGRSFNFVDPTDNHIDIREIAHALSHICRFTGHTRHFYSVAQHSVMVSRIVPSEFALAALLHDAPEAYLGDVSSPLRHLLPDYEALYARVEQWVFAAFGLPATLPDAVLKADLVMLATEKRDLLPRSRAPRDELWACLDGVSPLSTELEPWPSHIAAGAFMLRFHRLTNN